MRTGREGASALEALVGPGRFRFARLAIAGIAGDQAQALARAERQDARPSDGLV